MRRLCALGLIAVLAGCTAQVSGTGTVASRVPRSSAPPSSTGSGSAPAATRTPPAVPEQWVSVTEPTTGASFELPLSPHRMVKIKSAADGTRLRQVIYQAGLDKHTGVSVTFIRGATTPVTFDLGSYAHEIVHEFRATGARDAAATERQTLRFDGYPALRLRVSFTPPGKPADPPWWFIEAIRYGHVLVLVQSIAFPPLGEGGTWEQPMRALQARAVRSLRLP